MPIGGTAELKTAEHFLSTLCVDNGEKNNSLWLHMVVLTTLRLISKQFELLSWILKNHFFITKVYLR